MMKKWILCVGLLFTMLAYLEARNERVERRPITLQNLTDGTFSAKYVSGINPIEGTDDYARITDDGQRIVRCSFKTGNEVDVLFDVDATSGESIERFDGYLMSPDGKRMLIQTETEHVYRWSYRATYYIYTIASHRLERLSDGGKQQAPVWSPDGTQVAFVRENNIFLVKLLYDNSESQVTTDGSYGKVINGIPDWVYEEEFSFNRALEFTADGEMLCWVRWDESRVPMYDLQMYKGKRPERHEYEVYPGMYSYKYPKAGEENASVSVWSYDIKSHQTRQLNVPLPEDGYIPRLKATTEPDKLIVFTMNRHQDKLDLYAVNPRSTVSRLLVREQVDKYIKDDALSQIVITSQHILIPSDRDGRMRLYVYSINGQLQRSIGITDSDITAVYGIDEQTGDVYFQAAYPDAHQRQVFVATNNRKSITDNPKPITQTEGWNTATFSGNYKYFLNQWSDYNTPPVFTIRDNRGKSLNTVEDNAALKTTTSGYGFTHKIPFTFTTSEGVQLDGWMILPEELSASLSTFNANVDLSNSSLFSLHSSLKYPVVMHQYSGPGSQQVVNSWSAGSMGQGGAFDYYLAQQGFVVVCVDGRGTGGRGAEFEKCTYLRLGLLEAKDQVETAIWLGTLPFVDKNRIGIWGWSYGGFNTLMSISEGRSVFRAGVAVAPPTNWRYYDSVYTERYMRTPQENPDGYADNPISRAAQLHGALLICHGLADDNVHPQNTFEYSEALVQADKDFRELLYTNRNHSIYGGNTRAHLIRQITAFFERELKDQP